MCGLVGIAGDLAHRHELFMKRLLLLDFFRGTDSTGLAAIRADKSTALAKAAVNPITFFDMKSFDKALDGWKSTAFIGHNRAATLGKVNDANAHPYQFGNITGAHNGTLDKATWQRLELEAGVDTDTDSAAVFACIDAIGIDGTIALMENGRSHMTGAWALTWYDKANNTINFLRNEHRPLWFGFNKKLDELYWASEWPMLNAAGQMTKKVDWDGWHEDEEGYTFFPFEEDHLYSIELDALTKGIKPEDIESFKGRKIEGREPAPLVQAKEEPVRGKGGAPWKRSDGKPGSTTSANQTSPTKDWDDDVIDFVAKRNQQVITQARSDDDPLNGFITEERFKEIAKYGCSYCAQDVDIDDEGYTVYEQEDCILCSDCSKTGESGNIKIYLPVAN